MNPFDGAKASNVLQGGGLPPSAVSGLVAIETTDGDGNKTTTLEKFCIGCGISGTDAGGGNTVALHLGPGELQRRQGDPQEPAPHVLVQEVARRIPATGRRPTGCRPVAISAPSHRRATARCLSFEVPLLLPTIVLGCPHGPACRIPLPAGVTLRPCRPRLLARRTAGRACHPGRAGRRGDTLVAGLRRLDARLGRRQRADGRPVADAQRGHQAPRSRRHVQVGGRPGVRRRPARGSRAGSCSPTWTATGCATPASRCCSTSSAVQRDAAGQRQCEHRELRGLRGDRLDAADERRLPGRHADGVPSLRRADRGAPDHRECDRAAARAEGPGGQLPAASGAAPTSAGSRRPPS